MGWRAVPVGCRALSHTRAKRKASLTRSGIHTQVKTPQNNRACCSGCCNDEISPMFPNKNQKWVGWALCVFSLCACTKAREANEGKKEEKEGREKKRNGVLPSSYSPPHPPFVVCAPPLPSSLCLFPHTPRASLSPPPPFWKEKNLSGFLQTGSLLSFRVSNRIAVRRKA